jgi:hypothetical protein
MFGTKLATRDHSEVFTRMKRSTAVMFIYVMTEPPAPFE